MSTLSSTLHMMQVTARYRVDAPLDWVRSFLVAGATDDEVSVEGDVVEVRQRDRLINLVVRNALSRDEAGATVLDIDARLRLYGLGWVVGTVFRGRVRRTLLRSLDALPNAIERSLEGADPDTAPGGDSAEYAAVIVEGSDPIPARRPTMTEHRHDADARTVTEASRDRALEADPRVPEGSHENVEKLVTEGAAGDDVVDAVKRVGREIDRTFGGEYEAREDEAAARRAEDEAAG